MGHAVACRSTWYDAPPATNTVPRLHSHQRQPLCRPPAGPAARRLADHRGAAHGHEGRGALGGHRRRAESPGHDQVDAPSEPPSCPSSSARPSPPPPGPPSQARHRFQQERGAAGAGVDQHPCAGGPPRARARPGRPAPLPRSRHAAPLRLPTPPSKPRAWSTWGRSGPGPTRPSRRASSSTGRSRDSTSARRIVSRRRRPRPRPGRSPPAGGAPRPPTWSTPRRWC